MHTVTVFCNNALRLSYALNHDWYFCKRKFLNCKMKIKSKLTPLLQFHRHTVYQLTPFQLHNRKFQLMVLRVGATLEVGLELKSLFCTQMRNIFFIFSSIFSSNVEIFLDSGKNPCPMIFSIIFCISDEFLPFH
jgi:hypothetical protein